MSVPQNKIKTVSEINTEELFEIQTYYHRFYDDEVDELVGAIKGLQAFWQNNKVGKEVHELTEKEIDVLYPYLDSTQHYFNEFSAIVSKGIAVIPQVIMDIRKETYPFENMESLMNIPKTPPPPEPKPSFFSPITNAFKKTPFDANSPYRLSNKRTKYLEKIEEKWVLINEYQTKGTTTWSRLILDVIGQKGYRDLVMDVFNFWISPSLSSIFHYGLWLNLANEKKLSRDIMMVGMQQTLRNQEQNPQMHQTPPKG